MPIVPFEADSIADLFVMRCADSPDLRAVSIAGADATYGEISALEQRIRSAFARHRIVAGDRVATVTSNRIEQYALMVACSMSGVIWCPLNAGLNISDLSRTLELIEPAAVFAEPGPTQLLAKDPPAGTVVVQFGETTAAHGPSFEAWLDAGPSATPTRLVLGPGDPFCMIFSGGTTGLPKGILVPAFAPVAGGFRLHEALPSDGREVVFSTTQLFHAFAIAGWAPYCMAFGHDYVLAPAWSSSRYATWVAECGATIIDPFISMMGMLLASHRDEPDTKLGPRYAMSGLGGADPVAGRIRHQFQQKFGVTLLDTYGSTEAGPTVARHHIGDTYGEGSSGTSRGWYSLAIVDPDDRPLPAGEVGEIVIRPEVANISSLGYWRQDAETLAVRRNLWIHTGDLGRLEENGELYFLGRQGHFFRRRGEMVSAAEVEHTIAEIPEVGDVVVAAVPSELGEDDLMACVVTTDDLDPEVVYRWCAEQIAAFKVPRYVCIVEEIPRKPPKQEADRAWLVRTCLAAAWDSLDHSTPHG